MVALPLAAALISLVCAVIAGRRYWARRRPHELCWGIAFGLFALGAFAEVAGDLAGWSPLLTRLYYVSGATLTVGFLGLGSAYVLLGRRLDRWGPGIMAALAALGTAFVFTTPVDRAGLDRGWQALQVSGTPTLWLTIVVNTVGTLVVVGGALYSAYAGWRRGMPRDRVLGLILIAAGTLVVAGGGVPVRLLGNHSFLYVAMAPGVAIILLGYLQANRASRPLPAPSGPAPQPAAGDLGGVRWPAAAAPAAPLSAPLAERAQGIRSGKPEAAGNGAGAAAAIAAPARSPSATVPGVAVRPLGPADAAAVRALLACGDCASALAAGVRYSSREAVAALLSRPGDLWLGAELDGRLAAVACLVAGAEPATRHTARLAAFAVDPGATGRGAGTALLAEALRWADEQMGLARLEVWAYPEDAGAARFYRRHGFVAEGTARNALFAAGRHRDVLVLARART